MRDSLSRMPTSVLPERRAHEQSARATRRAAKPRARSSRTAAALAERPGQAQLGARHARDAVVALGQRHPAVGEPPHDHAEGERDHQEVDAGGAQATSPKMRGDRRRPAAMPTTQRQPRSPRRARSPGCPRCRRRAPRYAAWPSEGEPGVAEEDVEAHGEDGEDERLGEQGEQDTTAEEAAARHEDGAEARRRSHDRARRITRGRRARWAGWRGSAPWARTA